jgi:hypothetical protein
MQRPGLGIEGRAFPITFIASLRPALLADRLTRRRSRSKTLIKFVKDVPHPIIASNLMCRYTNA